MQRNLLCWGTCRSLQEFAGVCRSLQEVIGVCQEVIGVTVNVQELDMMGHAILT